MSLVIPKVKPSLSTGAASQYQLINVKILVEHEGEMLRVGFRIVQNLQMNNEKTVPGDSIRLSHCKNPYLQSNIVECHKGFWSLLAWDWNHLNYCWWKNVLNKHLRCIIPCRSWNIYHINWCRISPINSSFASCSSNEKTSAFDQGRCIAGKWWLLWPYSCMSLGSTNMPLGQCLDFAIYTYTYVNLALSLYILGRPSQ